MTKYYFEDIHTGELFTESEAKKEARERYDVGDETNIFTFNDHFRKTDIEDKSEETAEAIKAEVLKKVNTEELAAAMVAMIAK